MTSDAKAELSQGQMVNHEFVNSLASVRSLSELLVDYPGIDDGERIRFLTMIREETERLVHLLGHLKPIPENA